MAPLKLIHFKPGQQPPLSRTPGSAEYVNHGDQQYQIDLAAVKSWKEGVKLGKAELVFRTPNHITHPTPETKEFFDRTGMRKDLSINHLMAAILNNEKVKVAEQALSSSSTTSPPRSRGSLASVPPRARSAPLKKPKPT